MGSILQNVDNELYIHNWKSYFDSFKTFEVIDAGKSDCNFFWDIWYTVYFLSFICT